MQRVGHLKINRSNCLYFNFVNSSKFRQSIKTLTYMTINMCDNYYSKV